MIIVAVASCQVDDVPVRASAVPLPSPLVHQEQQPVRGQKPWFGPPILAAEASAVSQVKETVH